MKKKKAAPKKTKKAAKAKTKPKAKKTVKAKTAQKGPAAKKAGKAKTKAAPKSKVKAKKATESHGLTVVDLFRMKQEREQQAAQDAEAWKHKKELPPQDQHAPEDAKGPAGKKSGFGGVRHH